MFNNCNCKWFFSFFSYCFSVTVTITEGIFFLVITVFQLQLLLTRITLGPTWLDENFTNYNKRVYSYLVYTAYPFKAVHLVKRYSPEYWTFEVIISSCLDKLQCRLCTCVRRLNLTLSHRCTMSVICVRMRHHSETAAHTMHSDDWLLFFINS